MLVSSILHKQYFVKYSIWECDIIIDQMKVSECFVRINGIGAHATRSG